MQLKYFLGMALVLLFAPTAHAQCDIVLSGIITEADTGEPLPFVTVKLLESGRGAVSDLNGNYRIEGICPGTYTLESEHLGCEPISKSIRLFEDQTLNLVHRHKVYHIPGPYIVVYITPTLKSESMSGVERETLLLNRGKSLTETMQIIPGMRMARSGSQVAKPVFRGLQGQRLLIINNGIRHEARQWGNEHAPEVDAFMADLAAVVTGPSTVRYGPNALGGVLLLQPKPLRYVSEMSGNALLNAGSNGGRMAGSLMLEGGSGLIHGLGWRLQGSLKTEGNTRTPDGYLDNTALRETNFNYTLGWRNDRFRTEVFYSQFHTRFGIFSGAHVSNLTDLNNALSGLNPLPEADFSYVIDRPRQQVMHELAKAAVFWKPLHDRELRLTLGRQFNERKEFDLHGAANDSVPQLRFGLTTYTAEAAWESKHPWGWESEAGLSATHQAGTQQGRFFVPGHINNAAGIYALMRKKTDVIAAEISGRYDRMWQQFWFPTNREELNQSKDFGGWAGGAGLAWHPQSPYWLLRLNSSFGWRPPSANELFADGVHHGAAAFERGNVNLRPERAWNNLFAFQYRKSDTWFTAELYHNEVTDFILLRPESEPVLTIVGAFPAFAYENVRARFSGLDCDAQYELGKRWLVAGGFSLLRARDAETHEFFVMMPADAGRVSLTFKTGETSRLKKGFVTAEAGYLNRQWRISDQRDFAPAPEAATLLHVRAGVDISRDVHPIRVRLNIENVLNTRYRDYMNRFRYFHDERGRNVTLTLEFPF